MRGAITPRLFAKILRHPFNIELCEGTLSIETYHRFLEQDRLYLYDFSRALKLIAHRLSNEQHQRLFNRFSEEALNTQLNLHDKYLLKRQTPRLFQSAQLPTKKVQVVLNYTDYLLTTANNAPPEVAVASLIPCFYIYSTLGLHMRPRVGEKNPYRLWIESYSNTRFLASTQSIIQIANELGDKLGLIEKNNMIAAFVKSTEFEISFWDHIYGAPFEHQNEIPLRLSS